MPQRDGYKMFSEGRIAGLTIPNRLVRSATWDPCLFAEKQMMPEVLDIYRWLAEGGVGLIITGSFPVGNADMQAERSTYADCAIAGVEQLPAVVRQVGNGCKVIAQMAIDSQGVDPSGTPSPLTTEPSRSLTLEEITHIERNHIDAIIALQAAGFDGVQFHAAHGTLLSRFLSPAFNRRTDAYGGSVERRVEIIRRIVSAARKIVGDFPIIIKANGTEFLTDGVTLEDFPALAAALAGCGLDAIEVSGGQWECLVRSQEEIGFRPVPMPESHTRLTKPERQSYFLPHAEAAAAAVDIPIMLVGGNRDVERLETVLQNNMGGRQVDFIALCRPLIHEPGLPNRWRAGGSGTGCISCNTCVYDMFIHPGREHPDPVRCIYEEDPELFRSGLKWLAGWVKEATGEAK
jgi:2,4-dienoyl-CoA reductase-like NADH-dependent reductase (Old Yellow Enzyme family)